MCVCSFFFLAVFGNIPFWCNWLFCSRKRYLWEWEHRNRNIMIKRRHTKYQKRFLLEIFFVFFFFNITSHYSSKHKWQLHRIMNTAKNKIELTIWKKVNEQTRFIKKKTIYEQPEKARKRRSKEKHVKSVCVKSLNCLDHFLSIPMKKINKMVWRVVKRTDFIWLRYNRLDNNIIVFTPWSSVFHFSVSSFDRVVLFFCYNQRSFSSFPLLFFHRDRK